MATPERSPGARGRWCRGPKRLWQQARPLTPLVQTRWATSAKGLKSGTAMKTTINIDIECTPAEARSFLGLPDVEPIQAAVMERLQERMLSEIDNFSPESLTNQWLSAFPQNAERMQEMFAKMFMTGFGQGRH